MTSITDLQAQLEASLNQYKDMRDTAVARLSEIDKEKAELEAIVARLNGIVGNATAPAAAPRARAPRKAAPARKARAPRAARTPAPTDGSVPDAPVTQRDLARAANNEALTNAVIDCIRVKGPIAINVILDEIGKKVSGARYDTITKVVAENKDKFKIEGQRPRMYSIA